MLYDVRLFFSSFNKFVQLCFKFVCPLFLATIQLEHKSFKINFFFSAIQLLLQFLFLRFSTFSSEATTDLFISQYLKFSVFILLPFRDIRPHFRLQHWNWINQSNWWWTIWRYCCTWILFRSRCLTLHTANFGIGESLPYKWCCASWFEGIFLYFYCERFITNDCFSSSL